MSQKDLRFSDESQGLFKLVPMQNQFEVNLKDILEDKVSKENPIDIFLMLLIKLKTEVKTAAGDNKEMKAAKVNRATWALITALKIFITRYCYSIEESDLYKYICNELQDRYTELYFSDFKVKAETVEEYRQLNIMVDALGVKYYQTLILLISQFFASKKEVFLIDADEKNNRYIFKYRAMTFEEVENKKHGLLNVNYTK